MANGRNMQLTKQIGEYLVCAELCRRRLISTTFTGNIPLFDVLAVNEELKTIPIQVKTINAGGSWQFDANDFLKIENPNGKQIVEGKKDLPNPDLICVFVRLKREGQNQDEFYICTMKDLQDIVFTKYKSWLDERGGRRPRNPNSTHCTVTPNDLKDYKDNWELIEKRMRQL